MNKKPQYYYIKGEMEYLMVPHCSIKGVTQNNYRFSRYLVDLYCHNILKKNAEFKQTTSWLLIAVVSHK